MMLTLGFTVQSIIILQGRDNTLFETTVEKNQNLDRIFTADDGLQFALGVVDFYSVYDNDTLEQGLNEYLILKVWQSNLALDPKKKIPPEFEI